MVLLSWWLGSRRKTCSATTTAAAAIAALDKRQPTRHSSSRRRPPKTHLSSHQRFIVVRGCNRCGANFDGARSNCLLTSALALAANELLFVAPTSRHSSIHGPFVAPTVYCREGSLLPRLLRSTLRQLRLSLLVLLLSRLQSMRSQLRWRAKRLPLLVTLRFLVVASC